MAQLLRKQKELAFFKILIIIQNNDNRKLNEISEKEIKKLAKELEKYKKNELNKYLSDDLVAVDLHPTDSFFRPHQYPT